MSITSTNNAASAVTFELQRKSGDTATYNGDTHTDLHKDVLLVTSVAPKSTAGNVGNRKTTLNKLANREIDQGGANPVKRDVKFAVEASLPAGSIEQDVLNDAAILGNLLLNADFVRKVFIQGKLDL